MDYYNNLDENSWPLFMQVVFETNWAAVTFKHLTKVGLLGTKHI